MIVVRGGAIRVRARFVALLHADAPSLSDRRLLEDDAPLPYGMLTACVRCAA